MLIILQLDFTPEGSKGGDRNGIGGQSAVYTYKISKQTGPRSKMFESKIFFVVVTKSKIETCVFSQVSHADPAVFRRPLVDQERLDYQTNSRYVFVGVEQPLICLSVQMCLCVCVYVRLYICVCACTSVRVCTCGPVDLLVRLCIPNQ